ncbi:MAG: HlyD family efflux transporter periplasmic adaptor subunit [Bacillota bacterium]
MLDKSRKAGRKPRRPPVPRRGRLYKPRRQPLWPWLFVVALFGVLLVAGSATAKSLVLQLLTRTVQVDVHRVEHVVSAQAYLARRELVFVAPVTGKITLVAREGERVRTGSLVAEISNPRTRAAIEAQIEQAMARLRQFEANSAQTAVALEDALKEGATRLELLIARARQSSTQGQAALERELSEVLSAQAGLRAAQERLVEEHRSLMDEVARVQSQRALAVVSLEAPWPGVISYALDGLEDALKWDQLGKLSARAVFTLAPSVSSLTDGQEVGAGERLFKLVDLSEVVMVLAVAESRASGLMRGMRVGVRVPALDDRTRTGQVTEIRPGNPDGYVMVQVTLREGLDELGSHRQVEAVLVKATYEGIRVPKSALVQQGEQPGVYVAHKTLARFRPVGVLVTDGRWVLVSGLAAGDEVVTTPRWVKEGQRIR